MIYTTVTLASFLGFFLLYNTSRKVKFPVAGGIERWLQKHPVFSKWAGLVIILASFVVLAVKMGLGVGVLTAFLLLMTAACIVIAIAPFRYFKLSYVCGLLLLSYILEFLFF